MIGHATPRPLRMPALAALAMAGLVAWGGLAPGGTTWSARARDAISGVEKLGTAALTPGAPQVGALGDSTERPRTDGGGPRPARAGSGAPALDVPLPSWRPDASLTAFNARTRARRETAPSTGPPSLPF